MLQIALPNKGKLASGSIELLQAAGYRLSRAGRELSVRDAGHGVAFYFLRPRDIAVYVSTGVLDLGITGRDMLVDSRTDLVELLALGFGAARFHYALPKNARGSSLEGLRIATSYPDLVARDLAARGIHAQLVPLDGAVEVSIQLGVADAIADVVQTGQTLADAGLEVSGPPILETEAILVAREPFENLDQGARRLAERLRGIVLAREFVMVEYDCPEEHLNAACAITPGIESPTLAPLSKSGWVAVKAMARWEEANHIMDALAELGAKGILITEIRTCRI